MKYLLLFLAFIIADIRLQASPESDSLRAYHRKLLQQRTVRLSTLWPAHIGNYCVYYGNLINDASGVVKQPEDMPLLEEIIVPLLAKSNPENVAASQNYFYLWRVQELALDILLSRAAGAVSSEGSSRYATLAMSFITRLNKELIPDFKPKPVYVNIMPPLTNGNGAYLAGMSPGAITDPKERAAYEAAIEENSRNNDLNGRQQRFDELAQQIDFFLPRFLEQTAKKYPDLKAQMEELQQASIALNQKIPHPPFRSR